MNDDDVRHFMKYPFNMTGADGGLGLYGKGISEPSAYGTNASVRSGTTLKGPGFNK
jgi:hypothetical protein